MNIDPETLKLILGGAAVLLGLFAPKLWEKLQPYWPKVKSMIPFMGDKDQDYIEIDSLDAYSLHEIVEYLITDRKAVKDDVGVQLVGTLGKHLYDLRLEQKK